MKSAVARGLLLVIALGACNAAPGRYTAGDSMLPTIDVGTRINVAKLEGDLARGRVIVFRAPEVPDREYVKRVLGLAGDAISVNGTAIVLNGAPIPRCAVGAWRYAEACGKVHVGEIWLEALAGAKWLVFHDIAGGAGPTGPWTVAPGEVFVFGDNRENSHVPTVVRREGRRPAATVHRRRRACGRPADAAQGRRVTRAGAPGLHGEALAIERHRPSPCSSNR